MICHYHMVFSNFFRLGTRYKFQENTSFDSSQIVFVHCSISDPNKTGCLQLKK